MRKWFLFLSIFIIPAAFGGAECPKKKDDPDRVQCDLTVTCPNAKFNHTYAGDFNCKRKRSHICSSNCYPTPIEGGQDDPGTGFLSNKKLVTKGGKDFTGMEDGAVMLVGGAGPPIEGEFHGDCIRFDNGRRVVLIVATEDMFVVEECGWERFE